MNIFQIIAIALLGLSLIIYTDNSFGQKPSQVKFISIEKSECSDEQYPEKINSRIVSIGFEQQQLHIKLALISNCCSGRYGQASLHNDSLFLSHSSAPYTDTTTLIQLCECLCCFELDYILEGVNKIPSAIMVNGHPFKLSEHKYKTQEISYGLLDGDTINYVDIYGFRHGRHVKFNNDGKALWDKIYQNNKPVKGLYFRRFYENGGISSEIHILPDGLLNEIHYDENGNKIKSCIIKEMFDEKPECKDF